MECKFRGAKWLHLKKVIKVQSIILLCARAGKAFEPFAEPCFRRCEAIMKAQMHVPSPQQGLPNGHAPHNSQISDFANRDFIICSLDLIAGLADGVGTPVAELIAQSELMPAVIRCCQVDGRHILYQVSCTCLNQQGECLIDSDTQRSQYLLSSPGQPFLV